VATSCCGFPDINLMPILYYMRLVPERAEALYRGGHLASYYDRHAERQSFQSTIPPAGPPRRAAAN
jgi:glutathione S-transferase